ncbi:hypothetical protein [Mycobacterium sp. 852013-50091_SCH5140682]|uniref:hypothetical protein n=1 Tax=Mycobacterium sp. 852013-50091_SCH5140682 TaxID=1834109 RepID=UPI000AA00B6D|nr:hypothetical protein [Mycobacterium sp. 852013-50091_SCH5140682]
MSDSADNRASTGPSDDQTRIIRRQPVDPASAPIAAQHEPKTSIIRRHPTGAIPTAADAEPPTGLISRDADDQSQTRYIPRARPLEIPRTPAGANPRTSAAAATAGILSGWATAMIATDLIAGWWRSDRLFCVAIGFLTAISAAATIGGLIALLLRKRMGRLLIVVGSIIGLLIFGSLFIAGARLHPVVYAMPVLPVAAIALTLLPSTQRWAAGPRQ